MLSTRLLNATSSEAGELRLRRCGDVGSCTLLLGVLSWPRNVAHRSALRANLPTDAHVFVRYVLPQHVSTPVAADAATDDVFVVGLPASTNPATTAKFLMLNRFFRYAISLPFRHIGRLDDDAIVNVSAIGAELRVLSGEALRRGEVTAHLVYAPIKDWYMWHRPSMLPSCNAFSSRRYESAVRKGHDAECTHPDLAGPFTYPAGAFSVYSTPLLGTLVARLDADEHHVLSGRRARVA